MADSSNTVDALYTYLSHACAGPLVTVSREGEIVFYFPQGQIEQVEASTNRVSDPQINFGNLPRETLCKVIDVHLKAEPGTDEVTALVALRALMEQDENNLEEPLSPPPHPHIRYFSKKLSVFDTNSHGGLSLPIKHVMEGLPPLDMSQQPPTQELVAKDFHGYEWCFGHVFREIPPQEAAKPEGGGNCKLPGFQFSSHPQLAWKEEDWNSYFIGGVEQEQQPGLVQEQQVKEAKEKHSFHPKLLAEEVQPDRQEVESQWEASPVLHPSAAAISEAETLAVAVIDSVPLPIVTQETSQVASALCPQPVVAITSVVTAEYHVDDSDNSNIFRSIVQRSLNDFQKSSAKMTYLEREAETLEARLAIVREQHTKVVVTVEQLKAKEVQAMRTLLAHLDPTLEESI